MSDENNNPRHPETYFLPPLNMILTFYDRQVRKHNAQQETEEQKVTDEEKIEKLIEKLSEKEE